MKFTPFSYTKLNTFKVCPYKFKLVYIDKLKPTSNLEHLKRGANIHEVLAKYPETTSDTVNKFFQSTVGQKYNLILRGETRRELKIGLDNDFNLCQYNNQAVFNGIIDLIYIQDDIVHLVDWKTGKIPPEQDWSQLELYAIPFLSTHTVVTSYVYIDQCCEDSKQYDPGDRDHLIFKLKSNIIQIEHCDEFTRTISWRCNYCQFCDTCNPQNFGLENMSINFKEGL